MPAPQYEQAGADIAGTGTTNTIPRWTGVSTLGDSIITQDVANSRIGVNSPTPASKFEVVGVASSTIPIVGAFATTVGGQDLVFLRGGTAVNYYSFARSDTNGALLIQGSQVGNNNIALCPTSGNVGIGTASPTDSGGWSAGRVLDVRSGSVGSSSVGYFGDSTRSTNTQIGFYGSGYGFVGTVTNHAFQILQNNGAAIVVDTSKNVGIGTPSPVASAKLTLGGAANSSIRLSYQTGGTTEVAFDQMNSATGEFRHSSGVSAGWGGFHTFYTDTTEKVRITSTGNVHAASGTTGMTDGFFYIPAAAGAPTTAPSPGTPPTTIAGRVPMYYDTTNNEFYVYNGAWKKVALT